MSRMDTGIGRGRRDNDSSSSRESSPARPKPIRSFSPTSDDGDMVIQPIADDDTPPPAERPVLRQAVGFSWDPSTSIIPTATAKLNTYEAPPPPKANKSAPKYLPGQEVPPVRQKPAKKRSSDASTESEKRVKHFNDEFVGQTGSFRLKGYNPTAPTGAPLESGSGPYSSLYRATGRDATDRVDNGQVSTPSTLHSSTFGGSEAGTPAVPEPQPLPELVPRRSTIYSSLQDPSSSNTITKGSTRKEKSTAKNKGTRASARIQSASTSKAASTPSAARSATPSGKSTRQSKAAKNSHTNVQPAAPAAPAAQPPAASPSPGPGQSHYRRDYEGSWDIRPEGHSQYSPHTQSGVLPSQMQGDHFTGASTSRHAQSSNAPAQGNAAAMKALEKKLRLVTILIEDLRGERSDHQLAEIRVLLRSAEDPRDGYWADAIDICHRLQSSPARIDGAAKVYTLRGKYRQIFWRISADGHDECESANISVSTDRTVSLYIDVNPPPGPLPVPPKVPADLLRSPTPEMESPSPSSYATPLDQYPSHPPQEDPQRKRRFSPSFDNYDAVSPPRESIVNYSMSHASSSYGSPKKKRNKESHEHEPEMQTQAPPYPRYVLPRFVPPRGYDSPTSDMEQDDLEELIAKAVSTVLQKDPEWTKYFMWKGGPAHVEAMLKQYRFIQRMMDEWIGKIAPFKSRDITIERIHVLKSFFLDAKWGDDCTETLKLLGLYGPDGTRCVDGRVIEMIKDTSPPGYNAKPIKRLLRLLREIDKGWIEAHPEDAPKGKGKEVDRGP